MKNHQAAACYASFWPEGTDFNTCWHVRNKLSPLKKKYSKWHSKSVKDFAVVVCACQETSKAYVSMSSRYNGLQSILTTYKRTIHFGFPGLGLLKKIKAADFRLVYFFQESMRTNLSLMSRKYTSGFFWIVCKTHGLCCSVCVNLVS